MDASHENLLLYFYFFFQSASASFLNVFWMITSNEQKDTFMMLTRLISKPLFARKSAHSLLSQRGRVTTVTALEEFYSVLDFCCCICRVLLLLALLIEGLYMVE
jgi:hypothetical protein